jgi:hypothetical protein
MTLPVIPAATGQINLLTIVPFFGYNVDVFVIILCIMLVLAVYALYIIHKAPQVSWLDMITNIDQVTGKVKVSTTKVLQLLGGLTATFIVIRLTLQNNINWDMFSIYLAYVASVEGFSKFILAKYGVQSPIADTPLSPPSPPAGSAKG